MTRDPQRRRRLAASYALSLIAHALALLLFLVFAIDRTGGPVETALPDAADVQLITAERASPAPAPTNSTRAAVSHVPTAPPARRPARPVAAPPALAAASGAVEPARGPALPVAPAELARKVADAEPAARGTSAPEHETAVSRMSGLVIPSLPPIALLTPAAAPSSAPLPTAVPTQAPTAVPTQAPTAAPTRAPTATPTQAPTAAPTRVPSAAPTLRPTPIPAVAATMLPRPAPSAAVPNVTAQRSVASPAAQRSSPADAGRAAGGQQTSPRGASVTPGGAAASPTGGGAPSGAAARSAGGVGPTPAPAAAGGGLAGLNERLRGLSGGANVDYAPKRVKIGDAQSLIDRALAAYEAALAPPADILRRTFGFIYERRTAGHPDSIAYVFDSYTIGPITMCKAWKIVEHPSQSVAEVGPVAGSAGIGGAVATNATSPVVRHDNGGLAEASVVQFPCTRKSYTAVVPGSLTTPLPRHPDLNPSPAPSPSLAP